MFIEYKDSPLPHAVIKNYFDEQELAEVWQEINFLTYKHKLLPPKQIGSANVDGVLQKQNSGLFLDSIYTNRSTSNILTHVKKLWSKNIINFLKEKHFIFKYLEISNKDITLLSYYEDEDHYKWHYDHSVITCLIHLYKEPLKFDGGELLLDNEDYKLPMENNRMIIFPSCFNHAVTPIKFNRPVQPFAGYGRYTISQFLTFN
jgi:Rps23 Pro-64 3,4-dihydroxylase Tpa1-like proline 4-hydroxylase